MKSKKIFSIIIMVILLAMMATEVFAVTDSTTVGELGSGYLNGIDPSAYAETNANSSGSYSTDYVAVSLSFSEYNPIYNKSYSKTNTGANYTTAWLSESGINPVAAGASHAIKRGSTVRSGSTSVSFN